MQTKKLISIVIPVYNEEGNLLELHKQLIFNLAKCPQIDYELLFVNDGSSDNSLTILRSLVQQDAKVKVVNFSRNFGHEIAMTAGLDYAKGDAVIFMDGDLQHPPSVIPQMIQKWLAGHDVVLTKMLANEDKGPIRKFVAESFYKLVNFLSDVHIPARTPDFRLIGKEHIATLQKMRENARMFRGMLNWLGMFNAAEIEFVAPKRFSGTTKYNLAKSLRLATDSILQFSIRPLRLSIYLSIVCAVVSLAFGMLTVIEHFLYNQPSGYATIICLITFLASLQFIIMGILGEYIGRIHIESKNRPLYFANFIENKQKDLL